MQATLLVDVQNQTGEGPLWHQDEKVLYWTDIPAGKLYRFDPATGQHQQVYEGRQVGGMTLQPDGSLLLFRDKGNVVVFKDGDYRQTIIEEVEYLKDTRWNDVIADPEGRVFAGTISTEDAPGRLYRIDTDGSYHVILEDQGTPNGMGFSPDLKTFYYQDSRKATLYAFDYERATGDLTNQRVLRKAREEGDRGRGDGLTVDADGNLWSGRWEGACVLKLDPQGVPIETCEVASNNVTCPAFGGENYGTLYVASANGDGRPDTGEKAGALFSIPLEVKGKQEFRSRLG